MAHMLSNGVSTRVPINPLEEGPSDVTLNGSVRGYRGSSYELIRIVREDVPSALS
jgi:hypothetical protein